MLMILQKSFMLIIIVNMKCSKAFKKMKTNIFYSTLKQKNIPYCVYYFIKYGHFNYVQKFEKEDDNSIYELIKNSISIKIYKNIPKNINNINIPKNMDSCMILELTGYLKDYYEEFFNKVILL